MWKIVVFWKKEKQKSGVCECACQILFGEKQFVLMYEGVGKCSAIIALLMCFSFSSTTCKLKWNAEAEIVKFSNNKNYEKPKKTDKT